MAYLLIVDLFAEDVAVACMPGKFFDHDEQGPPHSNELLEDATRQYLIVHHHPGSSTMAAESANLRRTRIRRCIRHQTCSDWATWTRRRRTRTTTLRRGLPLAWAIAVLTLAGFPRRNLGSSARRAISA